MFICEFIDPVFWKALPSEDAIREPLWKFIITFLLVLDFRISPEFSFIHRPILRELTARVFEPLKSLFVPRWFKVTSKPPFPVCAFFHSLSFKWHWYIAVHSTGTIRYSFYYIITLGYVIMPVPNCPRDPSGKLCLNLFVYFKVKFHLFIYFSPFCRKRPMWHTLPGHLTHEDKMCIVYTLLSFRCCHCNYM